MTNKSQDAYKTIGEVAEILNLFNRKTGNLSTHTLRFWEKEFRQIKPKIFAGNRRYYDENTIKILKKIKFLLKDKGMTIKGVKKVLISDESKLDEINNTSINTKNILKSKLSKISKIIKKLKK
jgi:DNA-binding transcriptional MerR regulator